MYVLPLYSGDENLQSVNQNFVTFPLAGLLLLIAFPFLPAIALVT